MGNLYKGSYPALQLPLFQECRCARRLSSGVPRSSATTRTPPTAGDSGDDHDDDDDDDCSLYYVCVFGGPLLESCTGGLVYSEDLQTCDWPR